jgi:hypothetical protein
MTRCNVESIDKKIPISKLMRCRDSHTRSVIDTGGKRTSFSYHSSGIAININAISNG